MRKKSLLGIVWVGSLLGLWIIIKKLRQGEDLPKGVALQWRNW